MFQHESFPVSCFSIDIIGRQEICMKYHVEINFCRLLIFCVFQILNFCYDQDKGYFPARNVFGRFSESLVQMN